MIEDGFGFAVGNSTLSKLKVPASVAANNVTLVLHLYSRYISTVSYPTLRPLSFVVFKEGYFANILQLSKVFITLLIHK